MRRLFASFLVFSLLFIPVVLAEGYTIPGSTGVVSYNNIGLTGQVTMSINVTLLNLAPYPKFIVVNPRYNFKVLRSNGAEWGKSLKLPSGQIVGNISYYTATHTLNYHIGFWIMPYETVKINFQLTSNSSYQVPLLDYRSFCGSTGSINYVQYDNDSLTAINVVIPGDEINRLVCGSIYPQLLNYPQVLSVRSMLPLLDNYIKVLKFEGIVRFDVINVPSQYSEPFTVFFAVAPPILFSDANVYDYYPNYTMTYSQYIKEFIWKFRGMNPPRQEGYRSMNISTDLFRLTNTLISGVSVPTFTKPEPRQFKFDFPVWIVFMNKEFEISYRVSWTDLGR